MNTYSAWRSYSSLWIAIWYGSSASIVITEDGNGIVIRLDEDALSSYTDFKLFNWAAV